MPTGKVKASHLWSDTFWMSTAGLVSAGLSILRALLLPKIIANPAHYGLFLVINLIVGYGAYAHLGVTLGIYRQIPYLRGAGTPEEEIADLRNASLGFILLMGLVAVIAAFLLGWTQIEEGTLLGFAILGAGAALVPIRNLTAILTNFYQAEGRFRFLAILEFFYFLSSVGLSLLGAQLYGVLGAAGALIIVEIVFVVIYWSRTGYPRRLRLVPRLDWAKIFRVMRVGLPLTIVVFLRFCLESVDKLFIARFIGGVDRGFLNLAATIGMLVILVPGKLGVVLNPELARSTGAGEIGELRRRLVSYTEAAAYVGALVAGLAVMGSRTVLAAWLPNYAPSLALIDLYAPRMAFYAIITIAGNTLINLLIERRRVGLWIGMQIGILLLAVCGCTLALFRFGSSWSIVLASTGAIIVNSLIINHFAAKEVGMNLRERLGFLLRLLLPLGYVGALVEGLKFGLTYIEHWPPFLRLMAGTGAFLVLALPLIVYGEHRLGLFKMLKTRLRERLFQSRGELDD
ncbi:MAG TPA: lipopolysaccharide biosynthesis protein [bacterium]|nr:lipopolysaccharide biosynthesis protein [bacterium]